VHPLVANRAIDHGCPVSRAEATRAMLTIASLSPKPVQATQQIMLVSNQNTHAYVLKQAKAKKQKKLINTLSMVHKASERKPCCSSLPFCTRKKLQMKNKFDKTFYISLHAATAALFQANLAEEQAEACLYQRDRYFHKSRKLHKPCNAIFPQAPFAIQHNKCGTCK
jgi:hypothetical protein